MLDNIEKNTEDQTDPFAKYGGKKVVKNEDPFSKYGGSILKKKGSSQPTSQEDQSESSSQQKERLIFAATDQQPDQQASAGSNGEPKIGTFTGFTPEQQRSMKAKPAPDYMVKKPREKEREKQTEVSKGELLIQSPPLGQETKSYYRVVADEKRDVENKIKNFEDKYLKAGIDIEQIKTDGTYQDLQKQKAQLDEEYKPVENALREVKKETTTFTRPIERLVSSFTDGKYTLANTETINLSKDVEDKLIDSFDKLPQEQKQKWAKGSLPTEAKEQLINTAKTEVLNEKYTSLKAEFSDYIKNVKDNPNISTEQKKLIQDQLKAKNDAFNAQVAIDFSGNTLKNNFKSTKQSKDLDEGILSKYEGFIPETLDAASTFIEGMGSVIAKGATGIPTLALLGAERFNQITGASNPDDYTPIEATLDLINDTTNYNFLPSSKSAEGNIVDEEGNLNLSYRSVTKTLANTLPFTLKIINDVKKGRIEGSPQSMISQLLNPKNNKQFRDQLIAAETAYKITIGDNYKQAKDLGMTDANAFTYANVMSMAEGVSESIMPDIKFFDTVAGSSIKEAFKGNLKNAATKEAAKTVTKDFFKNIGGELGEEEFTLAVEDGLKYSMLLNHKNSEFFNLTKQKELAASTIILSGALGGVAIPNKLKESKKDIYTGVYNNIADIQDLFATEIKSPLTDKKTKESIYEAYKFASDVANAVAKAPETVTADQIDLLVQKNKLEEKKKNIDTAFHPDINKEIADIDTKIADMSKAKEVTAEVTAPVVEEIKTDSKIPKVEAKTIEIVSGEKAEVSGIEITYPTEEEAGVRKKERTSSEYVNKAADLLPEENIDDIKKELEVDFGLLTAENPMAQPLTEAENIKLNEKAENWLVSKGYKPRKVTGKYDQAENSFFVPKLTKEDAIAFAKEFNQESVAHSEGLIYQDGSINPRVKAEDNFSFEDYSPESNYVSIVKTKDGLKTFSVGYDFETKIKPETEIDTELEAITKLFDESEQGGNVTDNNIENGKKAIENIVPDVEWIIHDTNESMMDATGSPDRGAYIMTKDKDGNVKKVIHINKASADGTTVAHEVFHAVLLEKVLNDADAQDLTRRMMKAVAKTASPELKRQLDEFARNYEENIRDEEKLAQLIGILAKNYDQLSQPNKTIIKKWLDKLAKMFGLKPFTDNEVIDLLNTIAGKTAKGEAITEEDVMILGDGKINVNKNVERQSKFIDSLVFNRFPTNKNTKVLENFDISSIDGQVAASTLSDKLTAGELKKYKTVGGKKVLESVYTFFGGIGYPEVTGRVWAASTLSGVKKIIDDMKVSSDGYRYLIPAVMSNVSHMSNKNMTSITMEVFKEAINNNELNRTKFKEIVSKAFDNKKTSKFKEGALNAISGNISGNKMADNLRDYILSSDMTFESRKDLLQSMVGNPESGNPKFSTVGTFLSLAKSLSDPIAKDADLYQVPVIIRTKGNLTPVKTDKGDKFYHESYGYHIESDQEIEVLHLDGIYNLTDIIPEFTKEDGTTVSTEKELKEKASKGWDIKRILTNLGRTHGLSKYSAKIVSRKPQDGGVTKRSQKSDEGINFETKNNREYTVTDNGEVVGRLRLTNNRDLGKGYLEVDTSVLLDDYIGKGIGSDLYRSAAKNLKNEDIVITSSKFRTEKSQSMWDKLEKAGEAIKIYSDNKLKRSVYALVNPNEVRRSQKVEWEESKLGRGDKAIIDRDPILQNAAERYANKEITTEEYLKIKDVTSPIKPITDFIEPAKEEDIKIAVGTKSEGKTNLNFEEGKSVGLRLDIPAYINKNIWAITVHEPNKGAAISYNNVARIKNVTFESNPKVALDIARKKINKGTIARMNGEWVPIDGNTSEEKGKTAMNFVNSIINNKEWSQVGMNPFRHSWFYDRADGKPVLAADELIQIGGLVYAKNVVKTTPYDKAFEFVDKEGDVMRFQNGLNTIGDYVRIAKANNFSDAAIRKFLKSKGFSDTDIDAAMSATVIVSDRPSARKINEDSKKAIEDRRKKMSIKDLGPFLRKSLLDRQAYIKRFINRIDNKSAKKAYDLLVTKAGASALASERFKRAEKKIYGGLSSDEITILDEMIYASRMIAINENRAKLGMEPYTGKNGYSINEARQDLEEYKILVGDEKFNDLSNRATAYFDVFKTNLKKLYDSGRINKESYDELSNTEYSPIKTIKYIIGDNLTAEEIDTQAKTLGIARKDIMKLSDSNENDIIMDSKWLLAMTVSSVEGRAFENNMLREFDRAINAATPEEKKALEEFVVENPVVGNKADGSPKYKYDDADKPIGFVKVSYFNDGNKREIVIKDEYAKQLLDVKNKNKALETLGALTGTKILRFFATGGNPLFIIGNTAVDFQNIAFFSDVYSKFKPLATVQLIRDYTKNFIKKIVVSNQYNNVFNEYINHGGALDYMASDGLRALESMNPIKGVTKAAQRGLIAYGRAMAFLGETSEVAFRLSVYDKVKNDSIKEFKKENNREPNEQELDDIMWNAARESRETMDFSQGGDVAKNIDAVFPYFNAALQGIRRPIDFAKKDPVGFSSSVLQYTAMAASLAAGSFAMLIKAVRDDEDDDKEANKKILEALNSLSEYEKANYHVIFTGNKDKDGEYEYYRVKKLPVLSVISTVAEQLIYKEFFDSEGIEYDMDSEAMMEAVSKSNPLPVTVQEVAAKNPVASGLVSYWANKDTFTGDKIFREPNNKKIMPEAEGMFDDRVAQIYKDLAPGFGLSPARTQVMFEKVITSGNTNPTIPLIYSAYDGIFNNNDGLGSEVQAAMSSVGDAFGKKLVRHTDKNIIRYKKQDDMEYQESVIETDVWKSEQKVYDEIRSRYEDKNPLTTEELIGIVEKNFDPIDHKKYAKKYNAYIQNMNVDKSVLDIIFEDVPEVQAMKLNQRYGPNLEDDELQELYEAMDGAGKKVNKKAIYIYNEKYNNRKD